MEKLEYKFDYEKLFGRMKVYRYSQKALAQSIGISNGSMSVKLNGKPFSQNEIKSICRTLDIEDEEIASYFFKVNVQKTERKQIT
ncbi:MAG: DUF739 family protein [Liquorilactobacillus hordei]|uniref:DUF739 family protein n=1 Tax=Liquorilactobacillus hordei TaxID=468911 RepID=UPI0039EAE728